MQKQIKLRICSVVVLTLSCLIASFNSAPTFGFSMSMTSDSDGVISGNVSPGSFSMLGSNTLSISSNCPDGYYVYVTGNEDNKLYLNGESSNESTAFSTSSGTIANPAPLNIAEWGIAFESNASLFMGVTSIDVAIRTPQDYIDTNGEGNYDTNEEDISLYYGIRAGTYHVAGTYTSPNNQATVTYSLVPSLKCVSVTFQFDAGSLGEGANPEVTGSMEDFEASYGALVAFPESGFSRTNYNFAGWSTKDNDDPDNQDENELHFLGDGTDELIDETVIYNRTDAGVLTLYPMWRSSKTYIQNWKGCANLSVGDVVTLYDNRDEQAYRVAKWKMTADGSKTKCWMMDNLNLGAVTLETDLTSENTNLLDDIPAATFNGWKGTSGTTSYTTGRFITRTTSDTYGNNYGVLYNYYVASAKTITGSSSSVNATSDICPAGWRLPTGNTSGEFAQLVSAYSLSGSTGVTSLRRDFGFSLAGYTTTSTPTNVGSRGYYWSSTYGGSSNYMYRFYLYNSTISSSNTGYRYYASSIKCVVSDIAKITFDKNDDGATGNMDLLNLEVGSSSALPSNGFSHPTLIFTGWNTKSDGGGVRYADGDVFSPSSAGDITLYAQWADASEIQTTIALINTDATTSGSTSIIVHYGDGAPNIINPQRKYSVSGFSTNYNNASGATVTGGTSARTSTYTFNGWYTASSGGTRIINSSGALVANTVYTDNNGKWKSVEPSLTLYARWGSGSSVTLPTITKADATCGWGASTNTSTIMYESGYSGTITASRTLYGVCKLDAYLDTGKNVNAKMKTLAAGASKSYTDKTSDITAIKKSTSLPSGFTATTANTISVGANPVYIYMSGSTLYYYSAASTIYTNADSSKMFRGHLALSDISGLSGFNTSNTTNMGTILAEDPALTSLSSVSGWDTSKVTSLYGFLGINGETIEDGNAPQLTSLNGLSGWNVSKVTDLEMAFVRQMKLSNISAISGWDVSKVTTLKYTFSGTAITSLASLSSWNVSNVTSLVGTFAARSTSDAPDGFVSKLTNIAGISGWDVSKVTEMDGAFFETKVTNAATINGWHVEAVGSANFDRMFKDAPSHPEWTYRAGTWSSDGTFTPSN